MHTIAKRQPWPIFAGMDILSRWTQKLFLLIPAWIRLGSFRWAFRLVKENLPLEALRDLKISQGKLLHAKTGVSLSDQSYRQLIGGVQYWKEFAGYSGVSHFSSDETGMTTTVDGIRFQVQQAGTLFVIDEIFAERLYDLRVDEDLIVLDIGMNVGVATLYFAARKQVKKVVGFEPLKETFLQARQNISLNKDLETKIETVQAGVSDYKGEVEVPAVGGGSAVFSTDSDFIQTIGLQANTTVKIQIMPIQDIIRDLVSRFPDTRLLLKLDCEGEEYKIIDKIHQEDLFKHIAVIALEWHFKGFDSICNILEQQGFSLFNLGRKNIEPPCGMIYAFNPKTTRHA
jgi:FkbM family methyltransferase